MNDSLPSRRFVALLLAIVAVAAACVAGDGDDATSAPADAGSDVGDGDTTTTTEAPADEEPAAPVELFSPTETDEPFDLNGGVTRSDEGVTVVVEGAKDGLGADVAQATAPWTTEWSRRTVDLDGLLLGIPATDPRDFIPPIDTPKFEPLAQARWLADREPGALVTFEDQTRFYPLSILTRHEIVNDRYGDVPVVVTYCPLCNTAISFDARVDGEAVRFGVSGLLRNSDLVMWDQGTTTLWQQLTGEAIVGELAGTRLEFIPTSIVSYADALESFPDAWSLSRETGFGVDYGTNAYLGYSTSESPFLFDGEPDPRYPALSRVVGVNVGDADKAYPFATIEDERVINDELGDTPIAVLWGGDTADALDRAVIAESDGIGTGIAFDRRVGDRVLTFAAADDGRFTDAETGSTWTLLGLAVDGPLAGEQLLTVTHRNEFWFAWAAFFPDAPVYGSA